MLGASSLLARTAPALRISRETSAPPVRLFSLFSRERRLTSPRTLQELSEVLSPVPGPIRWPTAPQGQKHDEDVKEETQRWEPGTSSQSLSFQVCKLGKITSHASPSGFWDLPEKRSEKVL